MWSLRLAHSSGKTSYNKCPPQDRAHSFNGIILSPPPQPLSSLRPPLQPMSCFFMHCFDYSLRGARGTSRGCHKTSSDNWGRKERGGSELSREPFTPTRLEWNWSADTTGASLNHTGRNTPRLCTRHCCCCSTQEVEEVFGSFTLIITEIKLH